MRYRAPTLILTFFFFLVRVGLCTQRSNLCRTSGSIRAVGSKRKASIAWTRVHTILITTRALKLGLNEMDRRLTWRHVDAQGEPNLHRTNDD